MVKAAFGIFLFILLYLFIKELLTARKQNKENEKENENLSMKQTILKGFSRKNKEIDLDERIVAEAKKLEERKVKLEKSINDVVDTNQKKG